MFTHPSPLIGAPRCAASSLHGDTFTKQFLPIHFVNSIIGISMIIEFDEGEPVFHRDLLNSAVLAEEFFQVALANSVGQTADENPGSHPSRCFKTYQRSITKEIGKEGVELRIFKYIGGL